MINLIIILSAIILSILMGYREVEILVDRGRYARFVQFDFTTGVYIRFGGRNRPTKYKDL